jgi:hypothetical protein
MKIRFATTSNTQWNDIFQSNKNPIENANIYRKKNKKKTFFVILNGISFLKTICLFVKQQNWKNKIIIILNSF